jgi:hypothetical protein
MQEEAVIRYKQQAEGLVILTSWSRVLEKPIDAQLVKIFPAFYGTRRFIAVFTRDHLPVYSLTP